MFISSVLSYHIIVSFLSLSDNFRNYFLHIKRRTAADFSSYGCSSFLFIGLPIYSLSDIKSISLKNYTYSLINQEYDQGCQSIFEYVEWENDHCCKCKKIIYRAVYCATHFNKCFYRHSKSLSVCRK